MQILRLQVRHRVARCHRQDVDVAVRRWATTQLGAGRSGAGLLRLPRCRAIVRRLRRSTSELTRRALRHEQRLVHRTRSTVLGRHPRNVRARRRGGSTAEPSSRAAVNLDYFDRAGSGCVCSRPSTRRVQPPGEPLRLGRPVTERAFRPRFQQWAGRFGSGRHAPARRDPAAVR